MSELKAITWGDIDWENCESCIKATKGREREIRERHVPFIGGVERIYRQLRTELSDRGFPTGEEDPIIPIVTFNKAIKLAFKDMGRKSLTLHDFRHLFATRCIESGVDIQTVSRWLGHEDGGTLAMKTYVHLLNSHSKKMAEIVEI